MTGDFLFQGKGIDLPEVAIQQEGIQQHSTRGNSNLQANKIWYPLNKWATWHPTALKQSLCFQKRPVSPGDHSQSWQHIFIFGLFSQLLVERSCLLVYQLNLPNSALMYSCPTSFACHYDSQNDVKKLNSIWHIQNHCWFVGIHPVVWAAAARRSKAHSQKCLLQKRGSGKQGDPLGSLESWKKGFCLFF